jgi:signal transduction histidine kinase
LLSPSQGFNLFQVIQEALINSIKHSNCSEIKISINASVSWQITIADNGTGIKTMASEKGGGNGIPNMQARAKDAGFSILWRRNDPCGTKVVITPTTN